MRLYFMLWFAAVFAGRNKKNKKLSTTEATIVPDLLKDASKISHSELPTLANWFYQPGSFSNNKKNNKNEETESSGEEVPDWFEDFFLTDETEKVVTTFQPLPTINTITTTWMTTTLIVLTTTTSTTITTTTTASTTTTTTTTATTTTKTTTTTTSSTTTSTTIKTTIKTTTQTTTSTTSTITFKTTTTIKTTTTTKSTTTTKNDNRMGGWDFMVRPTTTTKITTSSTTSKNDDKIGGWDFLVDFGSFMVDKSEGLEMAAPEMALFGDNRDKIIGFIDHFIDAVPNWNGPAVEDILNYGCLCNLKGSSKELRKGLGRALDAFDSACQQWQQCHTCTQMDDMDCPDPLFVNYETGFSLAGVVSCDDKQEDCAKWSCLCDKNFASQIVTLVTRGEFDSKNAHSSPEFNAELQCKWDWNMPFETHDECCGIYPKRFPYSTSYGNRGCCVDKTFNSAEGVCCTDGNISQSGNC